MSLLNASAYAILASCLPFSPFLIRKLFSAVVYNILRFAATSANLWASSAHVCSAQFTDVSDCQSTSNTA